jgi:hypothetical protein
MRGVLTAPSDVAAAIAAALNLPDKTYAFTLRIRVGEAATVEVEFYPDEQSGAALVPLLKRYHLQEVEDETPTTPDT